MENFISKTMNCVIFIQCLIIHITYEETHQTKSLEELVEEYEDYKNPMIAVTESDNYNIYEDFYDQFDNEIGVESSMNMIFFGPASSFMRLDSETILHLLLHTKKHLIPIRRIILAWDMITDGKTAAFLQGREYSAFGVLLNHVPEGDLYYVNFGDASVMKYFASTNINLHERKMGVLAAAYRRYFGNDWYMNSTYINDLGYLFCAFPWYILNKIKPETFKEISPELLGKLKRCDVRQSKTLYNIATHSEAYGEPYKWSSHEISRLSSLFTYIPKEDISAIQLEAIAALQPTVMKQIPQEKLEYFTKDQIMRLIPITRRIYILRMQLKSSLDTLQITKFIGGVKPYQSKNIMFVLQVILILSPRLS